ENMKLKYFISTAFILGVSANAQAQKWFNCKACPAGTYSDGIHGCKTCPAGTYSSAGATSCTSCPKGQYQDGTGATGCKTCSANTHPTSVSGKNCGNYTVNVTGYCQATGSKSSTANPAKVETTTINLGSAGVGQTCTNNVITNCTGKPDHSHYTTKGTCDWACDSNYEKSGNSCNKKESPNDWGYCECHGGGGECDIGGGNCTSSESSSTTVTQRSGCSSGSSSSWKNEATGREGGSGYSCTFRKANITLGTCKCVSGCENCQTTYSTYNNIPEETCKAKESRGDRGGTDCSWSRN
nr:hypothetical protein [bacterium]